MSGRVRVRSTVLPDDEAAVARLVSATGKFDAEEIEVARELVRARLDTGAASGYEFFFAHRADEEAPAAYACWGRAPGSRESFHLYWIVVDPAVQGLGLGRLLLANVEGAVAACGGGALWIETAGRAEYAPSRAFYERAGYVVAARLEGFYSPVDDKVIYRKSVGRRSFESLGGETLQEAKGVLTEGAHPVAPFLHDHRRTA